MELLYIWVEEYKNIKRQEFNFSTKLRFHYDYDTTELTLSKREIENVNFFHEKVSNVTAIVGQNGAGKTTLLEIIAQAISSNKNNVVSDAQESHFKDANYLVIYSIGKTWWLDKGKDFKIKNETSIDFLSNKPIESMLAIYHSNIYTRQGNIINEQKGVIDISTEKLIKPNKRENQEFGLKLYVNYIPMQSSFLSQNSSGSFGIGLPKFLKLSFGWLSTDKTRINNILNNMTNNDKNQKKEKSDQTLLDKLKDDKNQLMYAYALKKAVIECDLYDKAQKGKKNKEGKQINKKDENYYQDLNIKLELFFQTIITQIENTRKLKKSSFEGDEKLYKFFEFTEELILVNNKYYLLSFDKIQKYSTLLEALFENDKEVIICSNDWVHDDSGNSSKLSTGEFFFLELFARIYTYAVELQKLKYKYDTILFLFDEVDLGFHPDWQKRIINILIKSLPKMFQGKAIQIMVTSHSPFIVSDLPNENIVFLTKDKKNGDCIVKDSLNDMKQTFGANIHTLLSDSFFMESLMGDFAKSKIDSVIKFLNGESDTLTQSDVEKIINMIGEPVIKRYLQKELANKRLNKVDDEIDDLKKRIKQLESKLKNTDGEK